MIHIQVRDSKNNVLVKPKTIDEAVKLAEDFMNERKENITVWTTEPLRLSANYYQYGYHNRYTFEYEKKFFMKVDNGEWRKISVETEEEFNEVISLFKWAHPDKNIETRIM